MASTWVSVPRGIERWSLANASAALLAATVSLVHSQLWPSLATTMVSIACCCGLYAPRGARRANLANLVTVARLAALLVVLATSPHDGVLVGVTAALVYALDGLDGWLARRLAEASEFGAHLDMETDSHVVLLLSVYLIAAGGFGLWVIGFGALRYVYVLARALAYGPDRPNLERRSRWGRWVFTLVSVSLALACVPAWTELTRPLLVVALGVLGASFAPDFLALARRTPHSTIA
jgi:phosphatidylglycerophosphate synthase